MFDTYKMQGHVCRELEKKSESGLKNTGDLDTSWKLIDSYYKLLKIDMLQDASEYSDGSHYSERRKRDSRGRYSRDSGDDYSYESDSSYRGGRGRGGYSRNGYSEARGEYMEAKNSYRSTRTPDSKRDMTASMQECMARLKEEVQDMIANADTREEQDAFKKLAREIGNLA